MIIAKISNCQFNEDDFDEIIKYLEENRPSALEI
jgi:hypothetical protein